MFAGRRDHQIKLRGRRIELLALEAILAAHPQIREAAALFLPNARPGGALGVALVTDDGEEPSHGAIRSFVVERLSEHYAPDVIKSLDALPRLTNGKVDRVRLCSLLDQTLVG